MKFSLNSESLKKYAPQAMAISFVLVLVVGAWYENVTFSNTNAVSLTSSTPSTTSNGAVSSSSSALSNVTAGQLGTAKNIAADYLATLQVFGAVPLTDNNMNRPASPLFAALPK